MKRLLKRLMKSVARAMWRRSSPIRRPLVRKFHFWISEHVSGQFQVALERNSIKEIRTEIPVPIIQELNLVLDGVVRELTRLQDRIEFLQQRIEEQSSDAAVVRYGTIGVDSDECEVYVAGNGEPPLAVGLADNYNRKTG